MKSTPIELKRVFVAASFLMLLCIGVLFSKPAFECSNEIETSAPIEENVNLLILLGPVFPF